MSVVYGGNYLGLGSFSRLACRKCSGETLHRAGKCVHCGSEHSPRDTVRQVKLDSINVYRLGVARTPAQVKQMVRRGPGRTAKVAP